MPPPPSRTASDRRGTPTDAPRRTRQASDPDVNAVYTAEDRLARWLELGTVAVFGSRWALEPEVVFARVDDVQHYADRVLAHLSGQGWRGAGARPGSPVPPVLVRERRGDRKAHYEQDKRTIAIPGPGKAGSPDAGWALRESVVLHELAHHLRATGVTAPTNDASGESTVARGSAGSAVESPGTSGSAGPTGPAAAAGAAGPAAPDDPRDALGHGPDFRRTLLALLIEAGHPTASALLGMAFADEGLAP